MNKLLCRLMKLAGPNGVWDEQHQLQHQGEEVQAQDVLHKIEGKVSDEAIEPE